ncbi:MAG: hypothetical protein RL194_389 [Pseudomonadota bacterium]|jgi:hypothetical protein
MKYPAFFDAVPAITLSDPLANFLGATDGGLIEYRYIDAVKLAGHSCPTVASAYWMTSMALQALYQDQLPERGNIRVEFSRPLNEGTTGVVASIAGMITGAAAEGGFKGLSGAFERRNSMIFEVGMQTGMRFTRLDTYTAVVTATNLQQVPAPPGLMKLMSQYLNGTLDETEKSEFRHLWQERVRTLLLDYGQDTRVFSVDYVQ